MSTTLFISDLHLSDKTPAIEAGLSALLTREHGADALYILGDFFEYWIGDDDDSAQIQRIKKILRNVTDNGTELFILWGNRDFTIGDDFAAQIGATLLGDSKIIDVAGQPTLILHGDTLCTDDVEYQKIRAIVRDPAWQAKVLEQPLEERRAFAQKIRASSIENHENNPNNIIDVNENAVATAMANANVKRMIHGHTHRPHHHQTAYGERIVLGDWTDALGWYIRATDTTVSLESFKL